MVAILSQIVEFRNGESGLHVSRVNALVKMLLERLRQVTDQYNISWVKQDLIVMASSLHDIGKIGVPDAVLNKVEPLTDEEWQLIRRHPQIGAEILSKSAHLNELKDIVLCHHERYDGKGYPNGREGCDIPIGARIIAICDSIDAITSNRCYRRAHDFTYCYQEIRKNLGAMYDPIVGQYVLDHWEWVTKGQKNKTKKATD